MRQLFISYARENRPDVDELVRDLDALGYPAWVDSSLRGGQTWWEEIVRRIADCDAFVVIVSQHTLHSVACERELEWALALNKPVLPLAVERLPDALPRTLSMRQIVNYSKSGREAAFALAGALATLPPAPPLPDQLPEPPPAPLSYLTDLVDRVSQPDALDHEQQRRVIFQLEPALRSVDPAERRGGRDVLERFRSRHDLYADVERTLTQLAQIQPDQPELSPPPPTISSEPGLPRPRWRRRSTAVIAAVVLLLGEAATAAYLIWSNPPVHPGVKEATFKTFPGHQTFPGHPGQKVFIEATSSTLLQHRECGVLELRDPAGKEIASGCVGDGKGYIDSTQLSADGDYTVILDPSNDATGEATVRVIDVVDQDVVISADGSPVTATIGQPGAVSRLRFTGTAGQKVSVVVTSSTLPYQCGVLGLRDRANKELASGCIRRRRRLHRHHHLAGRRRVHDPRRPQRRRNRRLSGATVQRRRSRRGDQRRRLPGHRHHRTTRRGQQTPVHRHRRSEGVRRGHLLDPAVPMRGAGVAGSSQQRARQGLHHVDGAGFIDTTTLRVAGDYTILVDPNDAATGNSQVQLFNVVDQDVVISADGSPVTATIGQPGAVSRLRFTGTAGQKVSVVVTSSTLPYQCGVCGCGIEPTKSSPGLHPRRRHRPHRHHHLADHRRLHDPRHPRRGDRRRPSASIP